jgi:acylglycerol lipase
MKLWQDGYHELQNEPDGVSDKLCEEVISWIESRLSAPMESARL